MNELEKIANSEEFTYMEKVAAIVDEFAAGNVDGENADIIATEAGIAPEDMLSMFNAVYGEDEGMEKTAAAEAEDAADYLVKVAEDASSTYLEKCAGIADAFAAGAIDGEQGDDIANELGLDPSDVASVFEAAYSDADEGMEKTAAAEDAADYLVKIAEDADSTYLEKCAGIADAYMAGAITDVEGGDIAYELGVDADDVDSVMMAAYGDELEKEAKYGSEYAVRAGKYIADKAGKVKDIITKNPKADYKQGMQRFKTSHSRPKGKISKGEILSKLKGAGEIATAGGKVAAPVAALGYGATKLFGNDKKKK